jgi:fibronectin-binding autotransporter adhesin
MKIPAARFGVVSRPVLGSLALYPVLVTTSHAQATWNGNSSNSWGTGANWSPSGIPADGADVVIANTTGSSSILVLDANRSIGSLQFGTTGTRNTSFTVRTLTHTLTIAEGLTATGALDAVRLSLHGNLTLSQDQEWNIGGQIGAHNTDRGVFIREVTNSSGTLTGVSSMVMNGDLTKSGSGQLVLAATTVSGSGDFIVNDGALKLNAGASSLLTVGGSGGIFLNNAAQLFLSRNSGTMSVTRQITLAGTSGMVWGGGGTANDTTVASAIAWNGSSHVLNLASGNRYESSGAWTGSAAVERTGGSTLTVSGNNSGFGGSLLLSGGTTAIQGAFGGSLTLGAAATLTGEASVTGALSLNGGTLVVDPATPGSLATAGNLTLSGTNTVSLAAAPLSTSPLTVISYGGSLTGGTGNLVLAGASNYRNATFSTASPGLVTLAVGSEARTWNGGAQWDINASANWLGGDQKFLQLDSVTFGDTGAGTIALSGVLAPSAITVNSSADYTFTAAAGNLIAGAGGLTKSGSGTLTLGGANTFSGGISISGGILRPTHSQALGAIGQTITIAAGATLDTNGVLGSNRDYHAVIAGTGAAGTGGALVNASATSNTNGFASLTLTADATVGGTSRWDVRPITAGTAVVDLGGHTLTKSGSGMVAFVDGTLSNSGTIQIQQGTLAFTRMTVSGAGTIHANTGTLIQFENYNSGSFTKDLAVDGATVRNLGADFSLGSAITLTNAATFQADSNLTLAGAVGGAGSLVKTGAATLFLGGAASHSGGTTLSAGTLQVGTGGTSGSLGGDVLNNSSLVFNRSDALAYAGAISGTGTLTQQGTGTLTLSAAHSYTGGTFINAGTLRLDGGDQRLPAATNVTFANVAGATLDLNGRDQEVRSLNGGGTTGGAIINTGTGTAVLTTRTTGDTSFGGVIAGDIRVEILGNKTAPALTSPRQRLIGTDNTYSGGTLVDGATLLVRGDGSLGAVPGAFQADNIILQNHGTLLNSEFDLTLNANRGITLGTGGGAISGGWDRTVTIAGVISGAAGNPLTVVGNNAVIVFTGNNTYAGQTVLSGANADLRIGAGGTSGSLGSGDVVNGGKLTFNRTDAVTYAGAISGSGSLTQAGSGSLTLAGNNSYTGATTVSAGTLFVNGALGATAVSIADGATLGGSGEIGGSVTTAAAGAIISPGNSPDTLTLGSLDVANGATFLFELGTTSDLLAITGGLTAGSGALAFQFSDSGGIASATPYTLFTFGSQTGLDYGDLSAVLLPGGLALDSSFGSGGWWIDSDRLQVQFIPEPSAAALAAMAGLALAARRRREA